jgi:hypothetical protein
MNKQELVDLMIGLLGAALEAERQDAGHDSGLLEASPTLPLVGPEAAVTSMGLVSLIADVESTIEERYGVSLTLVSEQALSRKRSPFRHVDALADYVMELVGAPVEAVQTV